MPLLVEVAQQQYLVRPGSGNFLTRVTAILTALFFVTSLTLAVFAKKQTTEAYSLKTVQTTAPAQTTSPETSPNAPKTGQ